MGSPDAIERFDTSAALAILDRIVDREEAVVLHSVASAWEAAWIACLTNSATWTSVAEDEFAHVVVELHGILWTVDRRKVRSTSLGLGKMSHRRQAVAAVDHARQEHVGACPQSQRRRGLSAGARVAPALSPLIQQAWRALASLLPHRRIAFETTDREGVRLTF